MQTIQLLSFNFDTVTNSVVLEALEHIKSHLEDIEYSIYFRELASDSLGGDPYVIYHTSAQEWISKHDLDVFDVIEDIREYHNENFGEFSLEVTPEKIVTAYMDVVLNDVVDCWLSLKLEEDFDLDLWNEEVTDHTRSIMIQALEHEIKAFEEGGGVSR